MIAGSAGTAGSRTQVAYLGLGRHTSAPESPVAVTPALTFAIPPGIHAAFVDARARAARDTSAWLLAHPTGTAAQFRTFVNGQVGPPPSGAALLADQQAVREAVRSRTPQLDSQALWIDGDGLFGPWNERKAAYVERVGAERAAADLALFERASELSALIVFPLRDIHQRLRPFAADPLGAPMLAGIAHASGSSYPSAHASTAFVSAAMLDALMPEEAALHANLAEQICFGRTYAAVHHPADIVAGAYVGSAAAAFVRARPTAQFPPPPPRPTTPVPGRLHA